MSNILVCRCALSHRFKSSTFFIVFHFFVVVIISICKFCFCHFSSVSFVIIYICKFCFCPSSSDFFLSNLIHG